MPLELKQGDAITTGVLLRRIPPIPGFVVTEATGPRPASHNLEPDTGEPYVSVELRDEDDPEGHMDRMLADPRAMPGSGVFEIDVAEFVERNLPVKYEPEEGPRHFGVHGWDALAKKEAIRVRRALTFKARIKRHPRMPGE